MQRKKKIAIIGVGLLGGSLALALKKRGGWKVVGWNHRASSRKRAARLLPMAPSLEEAVRGSRVVVLCAHPRATLDLLRQIAPWLEKDAMVLDVSSLKKALVEEACKIRGLKRRFVPCHPMAGKEKSGPEASDADLFAGKQVFLTPMPGTPRMGVRAARAFWKSLGAHAQVWNPAAHDKRVALTSHLPHLLACVLVEQYGRAVKADRKLKDALGTGFRDFTRIAAGHPEMWADILTLNSGEIAAELVRFRRRLQDLEKDVRGKRRATWARFFEKARAVREQL
jgi:prephenate dehydrogenase